jgi:NCS1 family nucleobase:cation symporter-1
MFLMFIAGAVVTLPKLYAEAGVDGFFEMAGTVVWTGQTPDGSEPMGFWKVAAFAWICNLAAHGALSDMAMFRYARKASYGLFSIFGMFLGHYLAWICAGLMGAGAALLMNRPLGQLDSGEVGYQALGWAGALAVVVAGWTTSNPTLYRVGLALQSVTPNWSRVKVTIVAGAVTTTIACFPFVFTGLLDFIGIYGLMLAPIGAIVLTEHWLFPRIGLTQYWASRKGLPLNWAALISWVLSIALGLLLERTGTLHLFYLFIPVYPFASVTYIVLARAMGAGSVEAAPGEAVSEVVEEPSIVEAAVPAGSNPPLLWTSGTVAAVALVVCMWLAIEVANSTPLEYGAALANFKAALAIPTLAYFIGATIFVGLRERRG